MKSIDTKPLEHNHPKERKADSCKCDKNCGCCAQKKIDKEKSTSHKVVVIASMLLLTITNAFGQDITTQSFWTDPIHSPLLPIYMIVTFMVLIVLLMILVIVYVVKVLNLFVKQTEIERAARLGIPVKVEPSWWSKFWDQINATVPLEKEKDLDLGHDFDGIRELDNHLPPWWKGLFYATIVWAGVYIIVYHVTDTLPLQESEYLTELSDADTKAKAFQASQPGEVIDENTLVYTKDDAILISGKAVFTAGNCGSCHRADGGGNNIGPNLTDEFWIHGGSIKEVFSTINKGVVEKGMPAWGKVMSPKDVRNVAFYIMSLQKSNPKDPKAPQGELYKEEVKPDSVQAQAMVNKP